jgi:hypothetical protein
MSVCIKSCDRCGNDILIQEIYITWIPENHAFSWLCKRCWKEQLKDE